MPERLEGQCEPFLDRCELCSRLERLGFRGTADSTSPPSEPPAPRRIEAPLKDLPSESGSTSGTSRSCGLAADRVDETEARLGQGGRASGWALSQATKRAARGPVSGFTTSTRQPWTAEVAADGGAAAALQAEACTTAMSNGSSRRFDMS